MRTLQRKLNATFAALGLLGVVVIAVTSYTVVQWRASEGEQERHYTRSLRLQEVRALTFEAYKEVPDAVIGGDQDARAEYQRRLSPIGAAFEEWAALADDEQERREVEEVRAAATVVQDSAARIFDLVETGRTDEAVAELEAVEEAAFEPFDALTTRAVESDRAKRDVVRADAADARRTANLTLLVAAVGVLSLLLLVGAYLAGGVFAPLRRLGGAVTRLADGDTEVRLPEDGNDEIAHIGSEVNRLAASLHDRSHPRPGTADGDDGAVDDAQLLLVRMVDGLREEALAGEAGAPLLAKIDATRIALDRIGALAHPVDLDLAPLAPLGLLHEVMDRVHDEVVRHQVSTRIEVGADLGSVIVDRARLRETLSELVRNALDALPDQGGALHLRAVAADGASVTFEVEDNGSGVSEEDLAWLYDGSQRPIDTRGVGLRLATSIVEQHGGRLQLESTSTGTIARVLLPHRTPNEGRT